MDFAAKAGARRARSATIRVVEQAGEHLLALALAILTVGIFLASDAYAQSDPPPATSSIIVKLVDGLTVDQQADVVARNGGIERSAVPALRLHVIDIDADELDDMLASYRADPQVVRAEPNNIRQSNAIPSDPLYSQQWALPRIGWDLVFGNSLPGGSVVVAVLDTGIAATHPDLFGNVVPGTSILDGSNGLSDPSGHGTMVAGTIAARTNTSPPEGIAGVAYAGVSLMPVTVLDADGAGQDGDIIAGVVWAVEHGANVIVMAFSNPGFSASLQEAVDYAWSNNIVLVAAAGNDAQGTPTYPAGDRGVIGVSATDENDQLAPFSNYGPSIFLAAPGTNVLTTDISDTYLAISGTSSSAAIVAGAAAQLMAIDPTRSNGVIVGRLARNADPAGTQDETGNGRVNLARALADTATDFVQPNGAGPVGPGGPFVGPYRAAAVQDGDGTMTVVPTSVTAGSTGQSFTFTFKNTRTGNNDFGAGSRITVVVPAGWTPPTTAAGAGHLAVANSTGTSCSPGAPSVTGTGPWTITISMACSAGDAFSLTYSGVSAPTTAGTAQFTTSSAKSGGTLTLIGTQPVVTVVASAASKLAFTTQASNGTGGVSLPTQPAVTVQDQFGNTVTTATNAITLAIATNPAGGTLSATTNPLNATAGVAAFSGMKIDKVGTGYTLTASATGLTSATSNSFNISVGPATQLAFAQQPTNTQAASAIAPAVTVQVQDAGGNLVTDRD